LPCFISTSDLISMNTGFSLILKSWANAYSKEFSAAFVFPDSQLISAARTWASTIVGSFYRQLYSSLRAELVSLANHLALAKSSWASVRPQFYLVTFSSNLIAFMRCLGGCEFAGMGFDPQCTRYSWANSIKKSALSLM